ncbi:MAG: ATP-binding protein, partial [Marinilabiliales bacterium]|nr:ATP-binding protein [Marinilabiliales bacterium]
DTVIQRDEDDLMATVPLMDVNKQITAKVVFTRSYLLLDLYRNTSFYMLLTMLISILAIWFSFNLITRRWLNRPLKMVTTILSTEDPQLIEKLKNCPAEFHKIGLLFEEFVAQKRELVKAKEKAEESDMLKSAFLANMSHEIRTPMNGILGFVELLKQPKLTGEEQREYIAIIEESGKRMLNIINDIISISKVEAGQLELYNLETLLNDQLRYIYTFFKPEADLKKLTFQYVTGLSDAESTIITDREKLYAILTNLVKNALKFTKTGTVELGYRLNEDFIEFFVKDTGIGIRQEEISIIFERFRQANESLSRMYEGAGLGLAITKAYVEAMGGKIWVNSQFGAGSEFIFTIPYKPANQARPTTENYSREFVQYKKVRQLKILLAEDDKVSYHFLRRLTHSFAKEILTVDNGKKAVEMCQQHPDIDLVLMDVQMPEMDGYEATRQIRKFNNDVIIIAQTALGIKGEKENALAAGCNDFLAKPIALEEFANMILKFFEEK